VFASRLVGIKVVHTITNSTEGTGFRVQPASCPAEFAEEVAGLFSSVRVFQSVAQQLPQVYQYLDLELPVGERMGKKGMYW